MAENTLEQKSIHEQFAQFCEQPSRPALRKIFQNHLGESNQIDFKAEWPDGPKLAKQILAFGNSNGGILIIGISELSDNSYSTDGVSAFRDKTVLHDAVKKFLPNGLEYSVHDFSYTESEYAAIQGKKFQVLLVEDRPQHLPFVAVAAGDGIKEGTVYVRDGASVQVATHYQLQQIINRRLDTGHSTTRELTLNEHLEELKMLYSFIQKTISERGLFLDTHEVIAQIYRTKSPNPAYPEEDFDHFIARMIDVKKKVIEDFLRH